MFSVKFIYYTNTHPFRQLISWLFNKQDFSFSSSRPEKESQLSYLFFNPQIINLEGFNLKVVKYPFCICKGNLYLYN